MQANELVALDATVSYDGGVNDEDFWAAVGRALVERRLSQGWPSTKKIAKDLAASPNERTLNALESGRPGHVTSLSEYCAVLKLPLTDLLASVLPGATVTADAMQVARLYDDSSPKMKRAVRAVLAAHHAADALALRDAVVALTGAVGMCSTCTHSNDADALLPSLNTYCTNGGTGGGTPIGKPHRRRSTYSSRTWMRSVRSSCRPATVVTWQVTS